MFTTCAGIAEQQLVLIIKPIFHCGVKKMNLCRKCKTAPGEVIHKRRTLLDGTVVEDLWCRNCKRARRPETKILTWEEKAEQSYQRISAKYGCKVPTKMV